MASSGCAIEVVEIFRENAIGLPFWLHAKLLSQANRKLPQLLHLSKTLLDVRLCG